MVDTRIEPHIDDNQARLALHQRVDEIGQLAARRQAAGAAGHEGFVDAEDGYALVRRPGRLGQYAVVIDNGIQLVEQRPAKPGTQQGGEQANGEPNAGARALQTRGRSGGRRGHGESGAGLSPQT